VGCQTFSYRRAERRLAVRRPGAALVQPVDSPTSGVNVAHGSGARPPRAKAAPGRRTAPRRRLLRRTRCLHRHAEGRSAVASTAVFKRQVAAEGSFAVVAGKASHSSRNRKMFRGERRTHLA